jgi:pilus assembly protein Flp/PilA
MRIVRGTKKVIVDLLKDESGASLLEYSILIGLITAGVVATISSVGGWVGDQWEALEGALTSGGSGSGSGSGS